MRLGAPTLTHLRVLIAHSQQVREERRLAVVACDRRGLARRWGDRDESAAFSRICRGPVAVAGG